MTISAAPIVVADAIRGCGLSLNPTTDGNKISIVMPKPSAEARDNLVKLAGKAAEKVSSLSRCDSLVEAR